MADMLTLIDLRRACETGRCPLCVLREAAEEQYLWFFAHEGTNDGARLARLVPARGFCTRHGNLFARAVHREYGDAMGVANSYHYVALRLIDDLEALHHALSQTAARMDVEKMRRLVRKYLQAKEPCPACAAANQAEGRAISCLLEVLTDPLTNEEWRDRLEKGGAFCWRHLLVLLERCEESTTTATIVQVQIAKWKLLETELEEYLRKRDYRFQHEPRGAEEESWKRALELFGKNEL